MKGIVFTVVLSMTLLFVWERVDIVRIGYHIERLKSQKVVLERERDELRVKLSALTAPEKASPRMTPPSAEPTTLTTSTAHGNGPRAAKARETP